MLVAAPLFCHRVKSAQPTSRKGGSPDHTILILVDAEEPLTPRAVGVFEFLLIDLEFVAVVAVEPIQCREPHEAPAILDDTPHAAFGETIFGGQVLKSEVLCREFWGGHQIIATLPIAGCW